MKLPMNRMFLLSTATLCLIASAHAAPENGGGVNQTVKPGQSHENGDGVKVTAEKGSRGSATMNPRQGNEESCTLVKTKRLFKGTIEGLDENDTVSLNADNDVEISGEGGTVKVGRGSEVTVNNTGGSNNMTVTLPGGTTATIPPGSSATFST